MLKRKARKRKIKCPECRGFKKVLSQVDGETTIQCPVCKGTGCADSRPKDVVDELYETFKIKDMSKASFRRAFERLTDPMKANRDLRRLILRKQLERTRRFNIDRRIQKCG